MRDGGGNREPRQRSSLLLRIGILWNETPGGGDEPILAEPIVEQFRPHVFIKLGRGQAGTVCAFLKNVRLTRDMRCHERFVEEATVLGVNHSVVEALEEKSGWGG